MGIFDWLFGSKKTTPRPKSSLAWIPDEALSKKQFREKKKTVVKKTIKKRAAKKPDIKIIKEFSELNE